MKKAKIIFYAALALVFVLALSACSSWSVEIKDPQSGAESASVSLSESTEEEDKITEIVNFPKSDFPKLSAKEQKSFLAALESLAEDYRSGKKKFELGPTESTDFAFPEPITAEDFSLNIREYSEGLIPRCEAVFPDNDEKGIDKYFDRVICIFYCYDEKWTLEDFYLSAAEEKQTTPDHTEVKTGFGTEYVNEDFGIKIVFPEEYKDSYTPVETETEGWKTKDKGRELAFYYKDCVPGCGDPYYDDWGAFLFSVTKVTHAEWEAMEADDYVPQTWKYIDETADWVYYCSQSLSNDCGGADVKLYNEINQSGEKTITVIN